jgi:hypothetical protein
MISIDLLSVSGRLTEVWRETCGAPAAVPAGAFHALGKMSCGGWFLGRPLRPIEHLSAYSKEHFSSYPLYHNPDFERICSFMHSASLI